ncbi:hypothetical protein JYU04_03770 [Dehalococcoides mccartyi]|nr:hypothetical protein [Dehalococcoides mccartyi]
MKLSFGLLLVPFVIFAGACTSESIEIEPTSVPTPAPTEIAEDSLQGLTDLNDEVLTADKDLLPLTFNVDLTVDGPEPAHLFVPSNRSVQIVLRNRARGEVHYRVVGLQPEKLSWISVPEENIEREDGVSDDDHDAHHDRDFVPWRAESRAGIQPSGDEVHGYSALGELDVVRFVATTLGTFDVVDPLHPEFSARLTVY